MTVKPEAPTAVLTLRIAPSLERTLERAARRRRTTKSELARELIVSGLSSATPGTDLALEARRQSLLVSHRGSEREALEFVEEVADRQGWK
jgi:hypothetical protein